MYLVSIGRVCFPPFVFELFIAVTCCDFAGVTVVKATRLLIYDVPYYNFG